jgi:Ca-activated chloride channel homolog
MKHFIIHVVIAVAIAFACMQINGAQSSDPAPRQANEVISISKPESQNTPPAVPGPVPKPPESTGGGIKINVKVNMVQVDAVVRDLSGNVVSNLGKEDFKVYDNNMPQELASFSHDERPLGVAIVTDGQNGFGISPFRFVLNSLKPQDAVCVLWYGSDVLLVEGLTTDRQRAAYAIDQLRLTISTQFTQQIDALYYAIKYLGSAAPGRRRAVIMISGGLPALSMASERDVITIAQEKDTAIYSLMSGSAITRSCSSGNPLYQAFCDAMTRIAHDSGGEVIYRGNAAPINGNLYEGNARAYDALNTSISHLRTPYSFGYYPSNTQTGAFHTITVRLADKFGKPGIDYFIQAKKGYYAVPSPKHIPGTKP